MDYNTPEQFLKSSLRFLEVFFPNADEAQKEAAEMLTQQGLAEIAMATPSEQVAYLLVERARLLDELESLQTKPSKTDAHEGSESQELKDILEKVSVY